MDLAKVGCSTFTHLGRHIYTIKSIFSRLYEEPHLMLELGSGFIEPFMVAELLFQQYDTTCNTRIVAVDANRDYINLIKRLLYGEQIQINTLALMAYDTDVIGSVIPNNNFLNRLSVGVRDYKNAGLDPFNIIDRTERFFYYTGAAGHLIMPTHTDIENYLSFQKSLQTSFDICYAGALFVNLFKIHNEQYVLEILKNLYMLLSPMALLGIGTSPSALYGAAFELSALSLVGFHEIFISAENFITQPGLGIFGDYAILAAKDAQYLLTSEEQDAVDSMLEKESILKNAHVRKSVISRSDLFSHLATDRKYLLLCAIALPGHRYKLLELEREYVLTNINFRERCLLNLVRWPILD